MNVFLGLLARDTRVSAGDDVGPPQLVGREQQQHHADRDEQFTDNPDSLGQSVAFSHGVCGPKAGRIIGTFSHAARVRPKEVADRAGVQFT